MTHTVCSVTSVRTAGPNLFVLAFRFAANASSILPGQFVNIKVCDGYFPLLRRPFSVYRVEGEIVEIIFHVVGFGTKILSEKRAGDSIDVLGPLGHPFTLEGNYTTALLVAGGLGVAPLPMITEAAQRRSKSIVTFLGARTSSLLAPSHLRNVHMATDDGSSGFHGTVVEFLRSEITTKGFPSPKIFGCGPNPMLKALIDLANLQEIPCEVSLESAMACGIGICQGCPVESVGGEKKYSLICKEGTVYDGKNIRIA